MVKASGVSRKISLQTFTMSSTWITLSRKDGPAVRLHSHVYDGIFSQDSPHLIYPSVITLIGRKDKSIILREILGGPDSCYPQEHHGQIHLWPGKRAISAYPSVLVDCELFSHSASHWRISTSSTGPTSYQKLAWTSAGQHTSKDLAAHAVSRILAPLSNIICYFAADLDGIRGVAGLLADHVHAYVPHDLAQVIPYVLIVVNTTSSSADASATETKLLTLLRTFLQPADSPETSIDAMLQTCFKSIRVLLLPKKANVANRSAVFRDKISRLDREARERRAAERVLFNYAHMQSICDSLLHNLCETVVQPFSFLRATRPHGFDCTSLHTHIGNLLASMPSEAWWCHLGIPLLGSSLLLASYPPGCHGTKIRSLCQYKLMNGQFSLRANCSALSTETHV